MCEGQCNILFFAYTREYDIKFISWSIWMRTHKYFLRCISGIHREGEDVQHWVKRKLFILSILHCHITAMSCPSDGILVKFLGDWKQVLNCGEFVSQWFFLVIIYSVVHGLQMLFISDTELGERGEGSQKERYCSEAISKAQEGCWPACFTWCPMVVGILDGQAATRSRRSLHTAFV